MTPWFVIVRKTAFYVALIFVQLVFVELTLQLYYRATTGDWLVNRIALAIFEADEARVYRVKSNLEYKHDTSEFSVDYFTDNLGFRAISSSTKTSVKKDPDVYRILFLGPSFSFGTAANYEDMYVTQIVDQLSIEGKRVEAINLGTPSQPSHWQMCWVAETAAEFDIDLVVQTSYGSSVSALVCDRDMSGPVVSDGYLVKQAPSQKLQAIAVAKQFATVFYSWTLYQMTFRFGKSAEGLGTEFYSLPTGEFSDAVIADFARTTYSKYVDTIWRSIGVGTKIIILRIPFGYEIHPEDTSRYTTSGFRLSKPKILERTASLVKELASELSFVFVDPVPDLKRNAAASRQYNVIDVHFTPAGNKTVSDYAAPIIQNVIDSEEE